MEPRGTEIPKVEPRFKGTPTPPRIDNIMLQAVRGEPFPAGRMGSNGGLIAAYDRDGTTIHVAPQSDSGLFAGYERAQVNVPFTGGDRRADFGREFSNDMAHMKISEVARASGVMGRTVTNEQGLEAYTDNPIDDGQFVDTTRVAETAPNGTQIVHGDLLGRVADGKFDSSKLDRQIGRMNNNNGTLAWCTPEGRTQIAPYDTAIEARLRELGYQHGDIFVPHSNGEKFDDPKLTETWAKLQEATNKAKAA